MSTPGEALEQTQRNLDVACVTYVRQLMKEQARGDRALETVSKQRAKIRMLKRAVKQFTEGHPEDARERGWPGMLHEEGCPGVFLKVSERDAGEVCACDGDWSTALVRRALR